jgi:hypothetical protein
MEIKLVSSGLKDSFEKELNSICKSNNIEKILFSTAKNSYDVLYSALVIIK